MKGKVLVLAFLLASAGAAQGGYWSRSQGSEPYGVVYQRTPAAPAPASPPLPQPDPGGPPPDARSFEPAPPAYVPFAPLPPSGSLPPFAEGAGEALPAGLLFRAELMTGVLATPLMDTPILARAKPGWCGKEECPELLLLGTATYAPNGRALLLFSYALEGGKPKSVRAVAFDPKDKLYGVTGKVTDVAPTLAADLLRATVSGLADWVRSLERQGQVSLLPGGGVVTEFQAPPFWAFSLGRIGGVFALPQESTAIVRALVRGAGEEILVATLAELPGERRP